MDKNFNDDEKNDIDAVRKLTRDRFRQFNAGKISRDALRKELSAISGMCTTRYMNEILCHIIISEDDKIRADRKWKITPSSTLTAHPPASWSLVKYQYMDNVVGDDGLEPTTDRL